MKFRKQFVFLGVILLGIGMSFKGADAMENDFLQPYEPKKVCLQGGEFVVGAEDFKEICDVGFFKIQRPEKQINIGPLRNLAKIFIEDAKYNTIGKLNEGNGFFGYEKAQMIRFVIADDYWDKEGWTTKISEENPNLSRETQKEAENLRDFGVQILQSLLKKLQFPQDHWFDGTGGSACGHGSYNLSLNNYNSDVKGKSFGINEHTDWGMITLLDRTDPGLQIKINDTWHDISIDEDYLIVNIGEPFTYLLSSVKPGIHRVVNQDIGIGTSIAMFINPRIGPFKESANLQGQQGMVYQYDHETNKLVGGITVIDYFEKVSNKLLGTKS